MTLKKYFLTYFLTIFILFCSSIEAREVKIGLWSDTRPQSVRYHNKNHEIWLFEGTQDAIFKKTLPINTPFSLKLSGKKIELYLGSDILEVFDTLYIYPNAIHSDFTLKNPSKSGDYKGKLIVYAHAEGYLTLVNEVDIEWYLCGVVESEIGKIKEIEAIKAQTLCARTYAIRGFKRHLQEGFHLCDQQHCQAYKSISTYKPIIDAVFSTKNEVIMYKGELIDALFSACCGGVTADAKEVWNKDIPYLKPVLDGKYCGHSKNFKWQLCLPLSEWRKLVPSQDSLPAIMYYIPDQSGRPHKIAYRNTESPINDNTIRTYLRLKSAKIKHNIQNGSVFIEGYGYGHGVGLCQEGAIGMAIQGFLYQNIIKYYYKDVTLGYDTEENIE